MKKINVVMPKFGITMKKGAIVKWEKKVGDKITKDETLGVAESGKFTGDIKAPVSGILAEIIHDVGDEVPVGEPIAIIETEASDCG